MLALITKLDGSNALLFHVEHCSNRPWQYRRRLPDGEWSSPVAAHGETTHFHLSESEQAGVQVEWRWPDGQWLAAQPHEFGIATATFQVEITGDGWDFRDGEGLRVGRLVRGNPAAFLLQMPPKRCLAGEVFEVTGTSVSRGVGQVLRESGEFLYRDGRIGISNVGPSQVALLPVSTAIPGLLPFTGTFLVASGRLSETEIQLLKQEPCLPKP